MHSLTRTEINSSESIATILDMNELTAGGRFMRKIDQYGSLFAVELPLKLERQNLTVELIEFCYLEDGKHKLLATLFGVNFSEVSEFVQEIHFMSTII
jgi:hypothetical protein